MDSLGVLSDLCGCLEDARDLGELDFEELAEQRTDIDAGKKSARAARSLVRAGVVAELGMVEREVHERSHGHRAAFTNQICNLQSEICNLKSPIPSSPGRRSPARRATHGAARDGSSARDRARASRPRRSTRPGRSPTG